MSATDEDSLPINLQAVLDWCEKNRPDLRPVVWAEKNNDGFILLVATAFEAGRRFQINNPDFPIDATQAYLEARPVKRANTV